MDEDRGAFDAVRVDVERGRLSLIILCILVLVGACCLGLLTWAAGSDRPEAPPLTPAPTTTYQEVSV